ncbi:polysaccharide biosynthesis tyrosine autokinase [uncultured Microbacterium sp.]|uniref:Capsular exopolysaccharide family n=1 Tax=uncultured Microbacterium sp. TaxID=191216 RepID=A0A1Y5NXX0_9MICO|nr:polysaccharide biosynthesis tyrosine autokinase [uncultured Microbacterium sp.]SBS71205.1 Capsular exopolysaccharide family [uncultured Microbacterium sp.]
MSLGDYLAAIWRNWLIVLLLAAVGGGAAYVYSSSLPETFRSTTAALVTSDGGSTTSELVQGSNYIGNLVGTYVLLAKSEIVLEPVIRKLKLDTTPEQLAGTISASAPLDTLIVEIGVTSRSRTLARAIADETMRSLTNVVENQVSPTTENGTPAIRLTTIRGATEPRFPIAPNTRLDTLMGLAAGLILGIAFAVVRTLLWRTIRSAQDVARITTVPVVGEIVTTRSDKTLPGAILSDHLGIEAESIRSFAANLSFLGMGGGLRSFVVTSAAPQESKSSVASALALILAESGKNVLLVDADLRHPSLGGLTQLEPAVGLTNVLMGDVPLPTAAQRWAFDNLHVLTAGSIPPNPSQLLASDLMRNFITDASDIYELVIVDSAPLLSVTDAKWLANMTDGALLVTRYKRTSSRALRKVVESLDSSSVSVLGVVLTRLPRRVRSRYGDAHYGEVPAASPVPPATDGSRARGHSATAEQGTR